MYLADTLCDEVAFLEGGRIAAMDSPDNLKLKYGEQSVVVEYLEANATVKKLFALDEAGKSSFASFILNQKPITLHSQEATLEDIFIRITGRGLTA
jgi:fluoroquinolone transport system ATP-binding protein